MAIQRLSSLNAPAITSWPEVMQKVVPNLLYTHSLSSLSIDMASSVKGSSYLWKIWRSLTHTFRAFLEYFGLRTLSPEEREHRHREGAKNIQDRLARELDYAQEQMTSEPNKSFLYLHSNLRPFRGEETTVANYRVGLCHAQGRRDEMEDEHLVKSFALFIGGKKYPIQLFGIFDGHAGGTASRFVRDHLHHHIERALVKYNSNGLTDVGIWNALKMAFVNLNEDFKTHYGHVEKICKKRGKCFVADREGTTATVAMILDGKLWTANVGDSRTVLDNDGDPIQLSEDAKPDGVRYLRGIQHRNGTVVQRDVPRVNGSLAVARALGDFGLKGAVSARPKITVQPLSTIQPNSHLILACDGIYDVGSTKQIVQGVHAHRNASPKTLAEDIVFSAYKAGSDDNLSALVVKLKH